MVVGTTTTGLSPRSSSISSFKSTFDYEKCLQDAHNVGKHKILNSSNVLRIDHNHHHHAPAPTNTPSIYIDHRGEIYNLLIGGNNSNNNNKKRMNVVYTNANTMRCGDIHLNTQHNFVCSGQVEVWILNHRGETIKTMYSDHQYFTISPYIPHVLNFVQDTIMIEWWEPRISISSNKTWYYQPYKSLINKQQQQQKLDGVTTSGTNGGEYIELVPKENDNTAAVGTDDDDDDDLKMKSPQSSNDDDSNNDTNATSASSVVSSSKSSSEDHCSHSSPPLKVVGVGVESSNNNKEDIPPRGSSTSWKSTITLAAGVVTGVALGLAVGVFLSSSSSKGRRE